MTETQSVRYLAVVVRVCWVRVASRAFGYVLAIAGQQRVDVFVSGFDVAGDELCGDAYGNITAGAPRVGLRSRPR